MRVGLYAVILLFFLYYFCPFLYGIVYDFRHLEYLKLRPDYVLGFSFSVVYFVLLLAFYFYFPKVRFVTSQFRLSAMRIGVLPFIAAFIFLCLSVMFFNEYGFQYRHKGTSISESAAYVKLLLLLKLFITGYVVYLLAAVNQGIKLSGIHFASLFLTVVGYALSMTGSLEVIGLVVIVFLLIYALSGKNLVKRVDNPFSIKKLFMALFFFVCFVSVVIFGIANKIGLERGIDFLFEDGIRSFLELVFGRISVYFHSVSQLINQRIYDFDFQGLALKANLDSLLFRLDVLLGGDAEKPSITSAMRLNSLEIYVTAPERNGASPGMVGSLFFIPFFPLSIFISLFYVLFCVRLFDSIFENARHLSVIPSIYLVNVLETLVSSQPDVLNLIGINFIQLAILYYVWLNRPIGGARESQRSAM